VRTKQHVRSTRLTILKQKTYENGAEQDEHDSTEARHVWRARYMPRAYRVRFSRRLYACERGSLRWSLRGPKHTGMIVIHTPEQLE